MEIIYLLCSLTSTFLTSSLLSLALAFAFRVLRRRRLLASPPATAAVAGDDAGAASVALYEGRVHHARRRPVPHAFEYPVRYALIDLDRCPQPSHLSAHRAREVTGSTGSVFLLTIPANVGYEQNPLSVYYCYDAMEDGEKGGLAGSTRLKMCIAEVTNTPWGERVSFIFSPDSDVVAKPLHVSPFMDMQGNWNISAKTPGEDLSIVISIQHPTHGNYFTATLHAKRVYSSCSSLNLALYFWLMPHKVAAWIYWQALKLWWKGVSFFGHPKYQSPKYREDALLRNRQLCCSKNANIDQNLEDCQRNNNIRERWCEWREAQWPWS